MSVHFAGSSSLMFRRFDEWPMFYCPRSASMYPVCIFSSLWSESTVNVAYLENKGDSDNICFFSSFSPGRGPWL